MGIVDVPLKLGTDFLIKTILPGIALFIFLLDPIIRPLFYRIWIYLDFEGKLVMWLLMGFALGLVLMLCDLYIYRFFMGIWPWPKRLQKWMKNREEKYYERLNKRIWELKDKRDNGKISSEENSELRILTEKSRDFPPIGNEKDSLDGIKNVMKRYPHFPTRFGNVVGEYEYYSLNRYGIHMMIFWNHLFQILSDETKEELKIRDSIVDMCVYLCFASLISAIMGLVFLAIQGEWWFTICEDVSIPGKPVFYFLFLVLVSLFFYKVSLVQQKSYGLFLKSIFDLNRGKLAHELGFELKKRHHACKEDLEEEKALWREYQYFYHDYKYVEGKKKGIVRFKIDF